MKKLLIFSFIYFIPYLASHAQDRIYDLKQLKQDFTLKVNDSSILIDNGNKIFSFKVKKDKDKRHYEFANPGPDSISFYSLLSIDKLEVNEKFNNAIPNVTAAEQLITIAASKPDGIVLKKYEHDTFIPDTQQELGGQIAGSNMDKKSNSMINYILFALGGLIVGIIFMSLFRKKNQPSPPVHISSDEVEEEDVIEETSSIEKLNLQVKKYKEDNRKLRAELKKIKTEIGNNIDLYKQHDAFINKYFTNVFTDYIKPFNEAIEKNNQTKAFQLLFEMAAHLSSITKHELRVKQNYDTNNISLVLKENNATNNAVETITSSTAKDSIPKTIKIIMEMMDKVDVLSTGNTVFYGYKIQKDK